MNKIILQEGDYSFSASTKEVTIINHIENFNKESLLLITNTIDNQILYNFGCSGFGGVLNSISNVITLEYDTTSMEDSDTLQIVLYVKENSTDTETINLLTLLNDSLTELGCIRELLETNNKLMKKILN